MPSVHLSGHDGLTASFHDDVLDQDLLRGPKRERWSVSNPPW
jgi:hypothetical protein